MRKIGSRTFFDHHAYRQDQEREKNEKIKKALAPSDFGGSISAKKNSQEQFSRKQPRDILIFWQALEFEKRNRHQRWYLFFYGILLGLVIYAFFTDNLIMSIIFILFGFLFYFYEKNEPKEYTFGINNEGVFAQDRIYTFDSLDHFWIFYEPGGTKELSLKSQKAFLPYINLPLGSTDPTKIREILLRYLPEKEHTKGIMDFVERVL